MCINALWGKFNFLLNKILIESQWITLVRDILPDNLTPFWKLCLRRCFSSFCV